MPDAPWQERPENARLLEELKSAFAQGTDLLVFLGAGLSYGVGRGRAAFEVHEYDDDYRFPSWPGLIRRMRSRLAGLPELQPFEPFVEAFFNEQPAIDAAQFFRDRVGEPAYTAFLREQFGSKADDDRRLTRSHYALVRLPIRVLFTTNYDELIEAAYRVAGQPLRVSATHDEFVAHQRERPDNHLVKLHGSIDRPGTVVLTRSDYARSRRDRAELFRYLGHEMRYTTFLFVGFSLSDPNFTLIYDDARLALGSSFPQSYVVQGRPDPVKEAYLRSLGVSAISLDWWEDLPSFLEAIRPGT